MKTSTEYERMKAALDKKGKASFGRVQAYAPGPDQGGAVSDPQGAPAADTVPTMLAAGEYVLPSDTVEQVGVENLEALKNATHQPLKNGGRPKFGYAEGGVIQAIRSRPRRIDMAEEAAVNNTPMPAAAPVKTIEQQTKEKVLQPAQDMVTNVKKFFGMAEGGLIADRAKRINAAVDAAAVNTQPRIPAENTPARIAPVNPLDAQVEANVAAARAKQAAENAQPKGFFGRVRSALGLADGGWVYNKAGGGIDSVASGASWAKGPGGNMLHQSDKEYKKLRRGGGGNAPPPDMPDTGAQAAQFGLAQQEQQVSSQMAQAAQVPRGSGDAYQAAWNSVQESRISDPTSMLSLARRPALGMVHGGAVPKLDEFGRPIVRDAVSGPGAARPPGYAVQELPVEEIDYSKTRNPGQSNLGKTVESFGSKPPQPVDPLRTAGNAVADAKAAAEAPKTTFGKVVAGAKDAAGMAGKFMRKAIPVAAVGATAYDAITDTLDTPTDAFAERFGIDKKHVGQEGFVGGAKDFGIRAAGAASNVLNSLSFGQLGKLEGLDKGKQRFSDNKVGTAAPNLGTPSAGPMGPPSPANPGINTPALESMGIAPAALERPPVPQTIDPRTPGVTPAQAMDYRGEVVRNARPDVGQQVNLGDYGGDGQAIFGSASKRGGRIDTFTGAGGGTNKATGYAPKGVDFGIKPGDVERYKAEQAAYSQLGPRPDALRNPVAYTAYQHAAAQRTQAEGVGKAAMVKAQADFMKAINDGNKDAAIAAGESAKAEIARVAENAKGLNEIAANFAKQGYFAGADPAVAEAAMKNVIAMKPLLRDGKSIGYADLNAKEKASYVGEILAATEAQLGRKGLFSSIGSATGQGAPKPLTTAQAWNQAAAGNLGAVNPFTDKQWTDGSGRAFAPGSTESLKHLEEQRKKDKR